MKSHRPPKKRCTSGRVGRLEASEIRRGSTTTERDGAKKTRREYIMGFQLPIPPPVFFAGFLKHQQYLVKDFFHYSGRPISKLGCPFRVRLARRS